MVKKNLIICQETYDQFSKIEKKYKHFDGYEFVKFMPHELNKILINIKEEQDKYLKIILINDNGILPFVYLSKVKNLVAAPIYDEHSAYMTPFHNNTKVISIGYEVCGLNLIESIIKYFIETKFEGGRHFSRIDMLNKELSEEK